MKYQPYFYLIGLLVSAVGFVASWQGLILGGLGFCAGVSVVQLLGALKGYLPAVMGGEKPAPPYALSSILAISAQMIAMFALWAKFSFWEMNPQTLRASVTFYVPTLLILLITMYLSTDKATYLHYQQNLAVSLVTLAVLFLFFLTPEKRLAQRFYSSEPEKLKQLLIEIEKRTPKKDTTKTKKQPQKNGGS